MKVERVMFVKDEQTNFYAVRYRKHWWNRWRWWPDKDKFHMLMNYMKSEEIIRKLLADPSFEKINKK